MRWLLFCSFLLLSGLVACSPIPPNAVDQPRSVNSEFIQLFQYELANRALARKLTRQMAEAKQGEKSGKFWQQYSKLEEKNYRLYSPVAKAYGLSSEASLLSNSKAFLSRLAFSFAPDSMNKNLQSAIANYLPKLKRLRELAEKKDGDFFQWVIKQEQAQLNAFSHAAKGDYLAATKALEKVAGD